MMRGNLFVVPCAALYTSICMFDKSRKSSIGCRQIFQDHVRITELVLGQVVAIRARIARELLFVERLLRIEDFLWRVAIDSSGVDLQRRERIWQPLRRCAFLLRDAFDSCRRYGSFLQDFFCQRFLQDAAFFIDAILFMRFPFRTEAAVRMLKFNLRRKKCHRLERTDFNFTPHDQT